MPQTPDEPTTVDGPFEEAVAQYLRDRAEGRAPEPEHYLQDAPAELAAGLREFFAGQALFDHLAPALGPTPAASRPNAGRSLALTPGARLGDFELLQELGRGGMGIVYKARQTKLGRVVALKMILAGAHAESAEQARFRGEAEAIARLQHPHIVQVFEFGDLDGMPFFALEYCDGGSLAERLRGATLPPRDAAAVVETLARALQAAHEQNVIHRDLKPANVLLTGGSPEAPLAQLTLKIADFGLARKVDDPGLTGKGAVVGTPSYMAPEQAAGRTDAHGPPVDVYALGAVLYECLTGRPPFKAATVLDTLDQVMHDDPIAPRRLAPTTPRDLETICLKCLQKEPGARYASAAALADDLGNWLAGRPINARPVGTLERVWRWCRRHPVPTAAAAAVLAVTGAAFALITDSRNNALNLADEKGRLADANGRLAKEKSELADTNGQLAREKNAEAENARSQEKKTQREATLLAYHQATALGEQGEVGRAMHALAHGLTLAERAGAADLEWLIRADLAAWRYHLHGLRRVLPHPAGVSAVAFGPAGRTLATACWDSTVRL
jgi:tRNA A-37 threonylcarbamoyl transferase component Bud32